MITISNEFVARADHSPVTIAKTLLRKVKLFHWNWPWLATVCDILPYQNSITSPEQAYLLDQLDSFLAHPATGMRCRVAFP